MSARRRYLVDTASPDDVAEFAAGLSQAFLECRELGHLWRPHTASIEKGYYERRLRCPRCKTIREEQISMSGEVLRRHMIYAEGYLAHKIGRIVGDGRGQLRLASIMRTMGNADGASVTSMRRARKAG